MRDLAVVSTERISDGLHAIKVGGPALARFTSLSFDDHVKLFFDDAKGQAQRRDYTPVGFDENRNELTLIFAVHDGGAASDWALRLQPGDAVKIGGPRGSMIIPENLGWYLLAGDLTAWPAMERRLQELPEGTPTVVILQSKDASDLAALPQRPNMVARHVRTGSDMLQAARELPLPSDEASGNGFAWCAGEAGTMAKLREVLINERGLPRTHVKASAYWKPGAEGFHETLS
ncbi:siderophore-interacting protein [Hydrogenophaga sp. 5NK40-0174]